MPAVDQTPTFKLNLPTFDLRVWHTYVNENFTIIDSVLQHYLNIENLVGVWRNATEYHVGERAVDGEQGAIYECLLDNVSAPSPTTFTQDRVSNPSYWGGFTVQESFKGEWKNSTAYSIQDFVVSGNIYAVCLTSHTSVPTPGVFGDDAVYWIYLINLVGNVLPSITGHGSAYIRARPDETAVEYRTPTQVRADLGISNVVTSFNTRIGDVTLTSADITNAGGIGSGGGTLTGPLVSNGFYVDGANGTVRGFFARTNPSLNRWAMMADSAVESGSNVGSDFRINRYSDAAAFIDTPLMINRQFGGMTINVPNDTNSLSFPQITGPAGIYRFLLFRTAGVSRFGFGLSNAAEGGSNAGSDFAVFRYTDAGTFIDQPLTINRASGVATFATIPIAPGWTANGAAGSERFIKGQTAGVNRWVVDLGTTATETGTGNTGSDFAINRFTDAGAFIDASLTINRANGVATFPGSIVSNANISVNTASGVAAWYIAGGSGGRQWNFGNNAGTFTIYDVTGATARLTISAAGGAAFTGDLNASGTLTTGAAITTNGGSLTLSGPVGSSRAVQYMTSGSLRWFLQTDTIAESGANAGSNFALNAFADNGTTNLGQAFGIVRATRVVTFAVAIVNPSDIRLKTHILPIHNALATIEKMQAIWYREKAHPEISKLGLIAQDVRKILPEVVHETADMSDDGDAILGIDYSKIVPMLVEAVKELSARVKTLEART